MHDEIDDIEWTDDSSASLGLSHSVHYAGGLPRTEEGLAREEKQRLRDEMERQGVKDIAMLEASNKGAHAGLDARIRELQATGLCTLDATTQATEEMREGRIEAPAPDPKRAADRDYLGAPVEELMRAPVDVSGGGSSKGRTRSQPVSVDKNSAYDSALADDSHGRSAFVGARVSAETKDVLAGKSLEVSAGEIVERVVQAALAIGAGPRVVDELLAEMESRARGLKAS